VRLASVACVHLNYNITWIIFMNLIFPKNWFPFYHMLVYLWNIPTINYTLEKCDTPGTCIWFKKKLITCTLFTRATFVLSIFFFWILGINISTYEYFTFQFLCCAVHCIYYIPELACVSIFISVLLLMATCFAQFITGKSKSWQNLSMVLIVDL
jgi:hypothetical protein